MIYRFFSGADPIRAKQILESILTSRALRPSQVYGFNDPFECKIAIDLDGSEEVKRARYFADHVGASDADCDEWLQNVISTWSLEQQLRASILQEVGVVCFTREWNNHLFWSHYASNHGGFCIGFDEEVLDQWGGFMDFREVVYSKTAPECKVFFERVDSFYQKAVFTKADCWSYEQEIRMVFYGFEDRVMPEGAIREVIVGCRASQELRNFARFAKFNRVEFFQANEVLREYRLDRHLVDPKTTSMTSHF